MKLKNSTNYPDWMLRRLISWCCQQFGLPVRYLIQAQFTNNCHAYRGRAWARSRRILIRIGKENHFPVSGKYPGRVHAPEYTVHDRLEGLVMVTAHEIAHHYQWRECGFGGLNREAAIDGLALSLLKAFREDRELLVGKWATAPTRRAKKAMPGVRERNQEKAIAQLKQWERKLKLAQGKVKKYRAKVRYYEKNSVRQRAN